MRSMDMQLRWEIVCPDGRIRHLPYSNQQDAEFDAAICDERDCRLYEAQGPLQKGVPACPGAPHRVRPAASAHSQPAIGPN